MRTGIERLAFLVNGEPNSATLGELAAKYGETTERIADAIDADKMRRGIPTQLPPVDWTRTEASPGMQR